MLSLNLILEDKVEKSVLDKLPLRDALLFPGFYVDFLITPPFVSAVLNN